MCQTLAQGGKRCDTHKDGSKATVSLTSRIADVQEKIVRKVFGALKKEGKGLESPDREEVESYAETGKFLTKYNPDIPERQKKTIMNQFDKAKEEEPSGPLFHAWKHTLPETLRRTRKTMSAIGIAGVIMATSACGGSGGGTVDTPISSPTPSTSISAPATPSPNSSPSAVTPGSIINGLQTKKELVSDGKGQYIATTISPDDPSLKYNPAVVDPSASNIFSQEDITGAQKTAVTFMAEEGIDSTLNGNPSAEASEGWWNANKEKFDPAYQNELHGAITSGDPNQALVFRGYFRENKYSLAYGPAETHILSRTITPTQIIGGNMNGRNAIAVQADVSFSASATDNGAKIIESTSATMKYTMMKNSEGKWLITGFSNTFSTTPVK